MKLPHHCLLILGLAGAFSACTPYPEVPPMPPAQRRSAPPERPGADQPNAGVEEGIRERMNDRTADRREERAPERREDPIDEMPGEKPGVQVAKPVPGKPGFVFSPFNNKLIDVKGIPSGTLVADPTYPAAEKRYFLVP